MKKPLHYLRVFGCLSFLMMFFFLLGTSGKLEAQSSTLEITGRNATEIEKINDISLDAGGGATAVSPDYRLIAFSSYGNTIVYNLATGKTTTVSGIRGNSGPNAVAFSPDSQYIAVAAGHDVKIVSTSTNQVIHTLGGHKDTVNAVAFSPTGRTLATGSDDRTIRLWSTSTWTRNSTLDRSDPLGLRAGVGNDAVASLLYTPNGEALISGVSYGQINVWQISTSDLITTLEPGFDNKATQMLLTSTGNLVALMNDHILVWNLQTLKKVADIRPSFYYGNAIAVSPNGELVAVVGNTSFGIFDLRTGEEIVSQKDAGSGIYWPDSRTILIMNGKGISVWGVPDKTAPASSVTSSGTSSTSPSSSRLSRSSDSSASSIINIGNGTIIIDVKNGTTHIAGVGKVSLPVLGIGALVVGFIIYWLLRKIVGGVFRAIFGGGRRVP